MSRREKRKAGPCGPAFWMATPGKLPRPPEFRTFYLFSLQKDGAPEKPWYRSHAS
jgi:hypothetical protein